MLDKKMQKALNKQMHFEFYSAYIYLAMSAKFNDLGLAGGANWMRIQYQEETVHALKFFDYISERGGDVALLDIAAHPKDWTTPLAMFEYALAHERKVTSNINELVDLALLLKDHATNNFLQWFVAEQVEEEATADDMCTKLRLIEGAAGGLYEIDKDLATRVFTPPAA
jgi:ferritin